MLDSPAAMQLLPFLSSLATGSACATLAVALLGVPFARRARTRRRKAAWLAAACLCRRALLPWLVPAVALGVAIQDRPSLASTVTLGIGALGAQLQLGAARVESRGSVATGRALGRLGGELLFLGAGALAGIAASGHLPAVVPLSIAGPVALLAGLAGKPRPSGTVAAVLYGIGLVAFAAS